MLTKDDLKGIRKIIREEVEVEIGDAKDEINGEVKMAMIRTHQKIDYLGSRIKNLEISHKKVEKKIGNLEIQTKKLRKDIKGAIEEHLDIRPIAGSM